MSIQPLIEQLRRLWRYVANDSILSGATGNVLAAGVIAIAVLFVTIAYNKFNGNDESARAKPASKRIELTQKLRLHPGDGEPWVTDLSASVRDEIEWRVEIKNLDDRKIKNTFVRAALPSNQSLIPGSVKIYNARFPDGVEIRDESLEEPGYDIGNYFSGSNAILVYRTSTSGRFSTCARFQRGYAHAGENGSEEVVAFATLRLRKVNCAERGGFYPDRPTFTERRCHDQMNTCGSDTGPVFNSFVDTSSYGDERAFVDARTAKESNSSFKDPLESATDGNRQIVIRLYVNNNADPDTNSTGLGIANQTRVRLKIPDTWSDSVLVRGIVSAENAETVEDTVSVAAKVPFKLRFRPGTARLLRDNSSIVISDNLVNPPGSLVGSGKIDGQLPGGFQHAFLVTATFDIEKMG